MVMDDPGCGKSVGNKEQRMLSTMTYVVWAGIDRWISLIIGEKHHADYRKNILLIIAKSWCHIVWAGIDEWILKSIFWRIIGWR
jgi:hypothetical protein